MNGGSDARRLAGLLEPFRIGRQQGPGCPVEIEYYNGVAAVSVRLGPDWLVKPDDALLLQLADWLSPQGVELLYK
jgi:DNA polymerase-3 subunit alpha